MQSKGRIQGFKLSSAAANSVNYIYIWRDPIPTTPIQLSLYTVPEFNLGLETHDDDVKRFKV